MQRRMGLWDKENKSWEDLSEEMQLAILKFLEAPQLLQHCSVSTHFNALLQDDSLWRHYYQSQFGQMDDIKHPKEQFIIALHYVKALGLMQQHPNQANILFQGIHEFLLSFEDQFWAQYYLGMLNFYGRGVPIDRSRGLEFFISGLEQDDHRAALELAILAVENRNVESEITTLSQPHTDQIIRLLKNANQKSPSPLITRTLAYLNLHGIWVKPDANIAETLFRSGLASNYNEAIHDLIELKLVGINSNPELKDAIIASILEFLETSHPYDRRIANFHSGWIWLNYKDDETIAREKFTLSMEEDYAPAQREMGLLYLAHQKESGLALALNTLQAAFENGDEYAGEKLFENMPNNISYFKDQFNLGNCCAIRFIASYYAKLTPDQLKNHYETSLWLQIAAQYNDKEALLALENLCEQEVASAYMAMGIIYRFGILHSDVAANYEKADACFSYAKEMDVDAETTYLEYAERECPNFLTLEEKKAVIERLDSFTAPLPCRL